MRRVLLPALLLATAGCSKFFLPSGDLPEGWSVDGDLRFIDPPDRVSEGDLEANGVIFAFDEGVGDFWAVDWSQGGEGVHGMLGPWPVGELIDGDHRGVQNFADLGVRGQTASLRSVYIHFDPRGQGVEVQASGHIRFDTLISVIVPTDAGMDVSDDVFRVPTTVYPLDDYANRGMIFDEGEGNEQIVIDDDGMGLSFNLETSGLDSARVMLATDGEGESPDPGADYTIDYVEVECTSGEKLEMAVFPSGSPSPAEYSATVYIQETFIQETGDRWLQWSEEHELSPDESTNAFDLSLRTGVENEDFVPGQSSIFHCDDQVGFNSDLLTYAFHVYRPDSSLADCLVTGHDPQGLIDGTYDEARAGIGPGALADCRTQ